MRITYRCWLRVKGGQSLVDREDWLLYREASWWINGGRVTGFGRRADGSMGIVKLHQLIADPPPGYDVHHVNADPLDNRRSNLLPLTKDEHQRIHRRRRE